MTREQYTVIQRLIADTAPVSVKDFIGTEGLGLLRTLLRQSFRSVLDNALVPRQANCDVKGRSLSGQVVAFNATTGDTLRAPTGGIVRVSDTYPDWVRCQSDCDDEPRGISYQALLERGFTFE